MRAIRLLLLAVAAPGLLAAQNPPALTEQVSGTTALLQAVSPVNERVVWVSGHKATYARTTDGGTTWHAAQVPGDSALQFRDVAAFDANTAYLMSAGSGKASRIYRTDNAGRTWTLQHTNPDSAGFYDCMDFWDRDHGLVYGDEVDSRLVVLETADGGAHWTRIPPERLPRARLGEGGFAASGTCLVTAQPGYAWIGTGAGRAARVLRTANRGQTWSVVETVVFYDSAASGIATVAFLDSLNGLAAGGNIGDANSHTDNVVVTPDGGKTWLLAARPVMTGAIYGSAFVPGSRGSAVIVSPKGAEYTTDGGTKWTSLDSRAYWAVGFSGNRVGWMVGPGGRITRVELP